MQRNLIVSRDQEPANWQARDLLQPSVVATVFRNREERCTTERVKTPRV